MSTIAEIQMMINYQDRQRSRRETQERQSARDNFNMFTRIASQKINTADDIVTQSKGESDLEALNSLQEQLQGTKTGVDYVDNFIDAKGQNIELRKKTVDAKNKITDHIDDLNTKLGEGTTVGSKELLEALRKDYINTADQFEQSEKVLIDNQLNKAQNHLTFRLMKDQYDTNKEEEGYQLPSHMEKADKDYFNEVIKPQIEVGEQSGSYVPAISSMMSGFKAMRDERTNFETSDTKTRARQIIVDEKKMGEKKEEMQSMHINELKTMTNNYMNSFGELKDPDRQSQNIFAKELSVINDHTSSMSEKGINTADLKGMLKTVDNAIMLNLKDQRGMAILYNNEPSASTSYPYEAFGDSAYLSQYRQSGDPLDKKHRQGMEIFIERNKQTKDGILKYQINFGEGEQAHRGMTSLINSRNKLIEMLETPNLFSQSIKEEQKEPPNSPGFGAAIRPQGN
tara:strand:+ start:189 stop:1553 length:1365 start_codon:yes stop_codon:yes gene_type:complete